jgi:hypothetical protein
MPINHQPKAEKLNRNQPTSDTQRQQGQQAKATRTTWSCLAFEN